MKEKRVLDGIGLAGVIVNVVFVGVYCLYALGVIIGGLVTVDDDSLGLLVIVLGVTAEALGITTLVFNAKVLSGELEHKKAAYVLGFICLSVLGSVLMAVSKENVKTEEPAKDLASALTKLKELYDSKAINEEEFATLKQKLMN